MTSTPKTPNTNPRNAGRKTCYSEERKKLTLNLPVSIHEKVKAYAKSLSAEFQIKPINFKNK